MVQKIHRFFKNFVQLNSQKICNPLKNNPFFVLGVTIGAKSAQINYNFSKIITKNSKKREKMENIEKLQARLINKSYERKYEIWMKIFEEAQTLEIEK